MLALLHEVKEAAMLYKSMFITRVDNKFFIVRLQKLKGKKF